MSYIVKLLHEVTRNGKKTTIESVLTSIKRRNSFSLNHGIREQSGYRFDSPEEAIAALDTLFDEGTKRVSFEIIEVT